jgi:hypothetical protein
MIRAMASAFVKLGDQSSLDVGQNNRIRFIKRIQLAAICLVLGCWVLLALSFIFRSSHVSIDHVRYFSIFDDGMISMRYAKNFVQHHQLVWNLGDRVEGFTCPLWTFVMIGIVWLSGTHYAPLVMQILGGLIYSGILWVFYRTAIRNKSSGLSLMTGLLLLFFSYVISYWALAAMEACAICLAFAIAVGAQYSYENGYVSNPLMLHSCLITVAYCLRPDGWLVLTPFFAACWFDSIREKKYRRAIYAPAIICAVVLVVLLARVSYYGEWVPNTYVLKMEGFSLALRLRNGTSYVGQFLKENPILLLLIALSALSKRRVAYLNVMAACIALGYQVYVGGDPWLYWRQLLPIYVAAAFAVLIGLDHLDQAALIGRDAREPRAALRALLLTVILAPIILFEYLAYYGIAPRLYNQNFLMVYTVAALAGLASLILAHRTPALARNVPLLLPFTRLLLVIVVAGAIVVSNRRFLPELSGKPFQFAQQAILIDKAVLSMRLFGPGKTHHMAWAGTYPYYVEGKMIDAFGKTDKAIARLPVDEAAAWNGMRGVPGHAKYDFRDTILKRRPDIIVDYTAFISQDLSKELESSYVLIKSDGVSLCVKKELAAGLENLVSGSCPRKMI